MKNTGLQDRYRKKDSAIKKNIFGIKYMPKNKS